MSKPRLYYVTVRDAGKTGFLLGPFPTHEEALACVDHGRELANRADPWAAFYAFGTSSVPEDVTVRTVFGKPCSHCQGTGQVRTVDPEQDLDQCPQCGGTGDRSS